MVGRDLLTVVPGRGTGALRKEPRVVQPVELPADGGLGSLFVVVVCRCRCSLSSSLFVVVVIVRRRRRSLLSSLFIVIVIVRRRVVPDKASPIATRLVKPTKNLNTWRRSGAGRVAVRVYHGSPRLPPLPMLCRFSQ